MRHIISILLQNEAGALGRVAGLFSSRGYNIESLSVAPTHEAGISRLTLVTSGSDAMLEQIAKQLRKLIDVVEVADLSAAEHLEIEMLMVKLATTPASARAVVECVRRRHGQILDETPDTRMVLFTGAGPELDRAFAEVSTLARVLESVRSGVAALASGPETLNRTPVY